MILAQKRQQGPESALLEYVISALRAVAGDVAQRPNCLLTDIEDGGRKKVDELGDSVGVDNDLGVLLGTGSDVGQSPCSFELRISSINHLVRKASKRTHLKHRLTSTQELHEPRHDTALDDAFDWGILFFRKQLAEFGRRVKLTLRVVGEHALDHFVGELEMA